MFRVLTIAREFGSGGGDIARLAASRLGWKLLDNALIEEIARAARVEPDLVRRFDERVDSWIHRVARRSLWHGAWEGVAATDDSTYFDCESMAALAGGLIREAYMQGQAVIVGRGAQCVLQTEPGAFHVYVYAPLRERVARVRERTPGVSDPEDLIRTIDARRAEYVHTRHGCRWAEPHLYDLLLCSSHGIERAVDTILCAMDAVPRHHAEPDPAA